jgi:hypothetical protein
MILNLLYSEKNRKGFTKQKMIHKTLERGTLDITVILIAMLNNDNENGSYWTKHKRD